MISEIIRFQLKGIKMIRLKGLNKILRTGLLAGALLGVTTPLMAKPLLLTTDLIAYLNQHGSNLKKEYVIDCNSQIDGSKYLNQGWNMTKKFPQEWRTAFEVCINKKLSENHEQYSTNTLFRKGESGSSMCARVSKTIRQELESNFFKEHHCKKSNEDGEIWCHSAYGDKDTLVEKYKKPKWWKYNNSHFKEDFERDQNEDYHYCLTKGEDYFKDKYDLY